MVSLGHMLHLCRVGLQVVRNPDNFIAATATLFAEDGDMMVQWFVQNW